MTQIEKNKPDEISQNDLLIQIILSNIPALTRGNVYWSKEIIGSDAWDSVSPSIHVGIGGILSQLVERRLLPFTYVGKRSDNKNMYRLD